MAATDARSKGRGSARAMAVAQVGPSRGVLAAVLAAAFALRVAMSIYTDLALTLHDRPELSTPTNSWTSLLEAHYLHNHPPTSSAARHAGRFYMQHASAYRSGSVHHSPLLLSALRTPLARSLSNSRDIIAPLIWSLVDVAAGYLVYRICAARESAALVRKTHIWPWDQSRATRVAMIYLFNPYTIGVCLARSTAALDNLFVLAAVYAAMTASTLLLSIAWALASLSSLYPILILPLLMQLCLKRAGEAEFEREALQFDYKADGKADVKRIRRLGFLVDRARRAKRWTFIKLVVLCPTVLVAGIFVSRAIALNPGHRLSFVHALFDSLEVPIDRGWEWAHQVYGVILLVTNLTPNLGLWWYFFMEIFDHFRDFFLLTFNMHVAAYVVPVAIKYRQDPLFGVTVMLGIIAVFKSYPTVGDHALFLSLLSLHQQIFEYLRYPLVSTLLYAYCTVLSPAFHHLWLTAGSGNANFFYAITLVWALGGGMLVLDIMWAWGRDRWEVERPPIRSARAAPGKTGTANHASEAPSEDALLNRVAVQSVSGDVDAQPRRRVVVQI